MELGQRIRKIRRELDLTQAEFAERLGSVQNTITGYETGRKNPSKPVIALICKEFGVNENWLLREEGEMFQPDASDEIEALVRKYDLSYADQVVIEKFVNSRKEFRAAIANMYIEAAKACLESGLADPTASYSETHGALLDSVSAAEAAYEKNLGVAQNSESTASNTIEGTQRREA